MAEYLKPVLTESQKVLSDSLYRLSFCSHEQRQALADMCALSVTCIIADTFIKTMFGGDK